MKRREGGKRGEDYLSGSRQEGSDRDNLCKKEGQSNRKRRKAKKMKEGERRKKMSGIDKW